MTAALTWVGARARWILIVGAFLGLAAPDLATALRPLLPFFVAMVYALAMLRIDPIAVLRGVLVPRRAAHALLLIGAMLVLTPVLAWGAVRLLGLGSAYEVAVVFVFAAPPIASSAAMCLIVGFSGARALELTVLSSLAMPFVGPLVAELLVGASLDISPAALGGRMALMILGGFVAAMVLRRIMGGERIARHSVALDGVAALGFLLFIMPLFDGVRATIIAEPLVAVGFLALSTFIVLGSIRAALWLPGERGENGALGTVWGTRSVAIYLAALPPDPIFTLFVALYQFPMAAIALTFRRTEPVKTTASPTKKGAGPPPDRN